MGKKSRNIAKCLDALAGGWYIYLINKGQCTRTAPQLPGGNIMTKTLTPKELALELGTDPRTVRKFLRSAEGMDAKVGKGQRWAIEAKAVRSLRTRFNRWDEARKAPAAPEADEVTEVTDEA